jgi:hypothetical protein
MCDTHREGGANKLAVIGTDIAAINALRRFRIDDIDRPPGRNDLVKNVDEFSYSSRVT